MSIYAPLAIPQQKPEEVFLFGHDDQDIGVLDGLLKEVDINIAGTIEGPEIAGVPSVDLNIAKESPRVPIILVRGAKDLSNYTFKPDDPDGPFRFKDSLLKLASQGFEGRVLHPCFVVDYLKRPDSGNVFVGGLPGAGNKLMEKIVQTICNRHTTPPSDTNEYLSNLCKNYESQVLTTVSEISRNIGMAPLVRTSYGIGYINYSIQFSDGLVHLCDIRSPLHLLDHPYTNHQMLDKASCEHFQRLGFHMVICARHPLDAYISTMHKSLVAREYDKSVSVHEINEDDITQYLNYSAGYYSRAFKAGEGYFVARYEDVVHEPVTTIRSIGNHIGVEISDEEAEAIWNEFGNKPLPGMPDSHFRGGGTGGWHDHIGADLTRRLTSSEAFEIFEALGYSVEAETKSFDLEKMVNAAKTYSAPELTDRGLKKIGANLSRTCWVESPHGDADVAEKFHSYLNNKYFRMLCDCAEYYIA